MGGGDTDKNLFPTKIGSLERIQFIGQKSGCCHGDKCPMTSSQGRGNIFKGGARMDGRAQQTE